MKSDGGEADEFAASAICESPLNDLDLVADAGSSFSRRGRRRRQAQENKKVCCHKDNIRPSCSKVRETHR